MPQTEIYVKDQDKIRARVLALERETETLRKRLAALELKKAGRKKKVEE